MTDENDNTPRMQNNTCHADVMENVDWTGLPTILQLHAVDEDFGLNGQIRFSIIGGNPTGQFILDPATGDLKVAAALDYEQEQKYRLTIRIQVCSMSKHAISGPTAESGVVCASRLNRM